MGILFRYAFVIGFGFVSVITFKIVTTALEHQLAF